MAASQISETSGAGIAILVIEKVSAAGIDVRNIGGYQFFDITFIRRHGIERAAVVGVGKIDDAVVFAEHAAVVGVAGGIAHCTGRDGNNSFLQYVDYGEQDEE